MQEAREQLKSRLFDVVISDMRLPDGFGMEILQDLRDQQRRERCVVMTAYGSAENAVEALRAGAFDYLTKPVDLKQFRSVVASAVQGTGQPCAARPWRWTGAPQSDSRRKHFHAPLIARPAGGDSEAMRNVKQRIAKVARAWRRCWCVANQAQAKELVAQALHACSQRAEGRALR